MFTHFNFWYNAVPAVTTLAFAYGWEHWRSYDRKGGRDRLVALLIAIFGATLIGVMVFLESFRGTVQVMRWLMGPAADDFECVLVAAFAIPAAAFFYGCFLWWLSDHAAKWRRARIEREERAKAPEDDREFEVNCALVDRDGEATYTISVRDLLIPMLMAGWTVKLEPEFRPNSN